LVTVAEEEASVEWAAVVTDLKAKTEATRSDFSSSSDEETDTTHAESQIISAICLIFLEKWLTESTFQQTSLWSASQSKARTKFLSFQKSARFHMFMLTQRAAADVAGETVILMILVEEIVALAVAETVVALVVTVALAGTGIADSVEETVTVVLGAKHMLRQSETELLLTKRALKTNSRGTGAKPL
jgi:hypothetical protein